MELTEKTNVWIDKDGTELDMSTMDAKHLQYAHTHACAKEIKYYHMSGRFTDLRDQLEEVAKSRGIRLIYPDETHPSPKWNNYFCAVRKQKGITLEVQSLDKASQDVLK